MAITTVFTLVSMTMGIPPTGKQVAFTWIHIYRIANGKLVEQWSVFDQMGLMQQLGVIPAPETV